MKKLIVIAFVFIAVNCYASTPKMLVDKNTNQILSWGYCDFKPNNQQIVIEGEISGNCNDGLKYENGKVKSAPEFASKKTKTIEERLSELEAKCK